MGTTVEYIRYVCDQIKGTGEISYRKMFGEYLVYVNEKPVFTVCDNTVYVKKLDVLSGILCSAEIGAPYEGAKPHYILEIDNTELGKKVIDILLQTLPAPKPKKGPGQKIHRS